MGTNSFHAMLFKAIGPYGEDGSYLMGPRKGMFSGISQQSELSIHGFSTIKIIHYHGMNILTELGFL
jgi:hypothetical protein